MVISTIRNSKVISNALEIDRTISIISIAGNFCRTELWGSVNTIPFLVFSDKQDYRTIWGIYYRGSGWFNGYIGERKAITNKDD